MEEIKPSNLELFRQYLLDLQQLPEDGSNDYKIYSRWQSSIEIIQQTANSIVKFLYEHDNSEIAQRARFHINHGFRDEYMVYKQYISYFLLGIVAFEKSMSTQLLRSGLLEKTVQEMTGFEFKTLLLSALKEYKDRQL